MLRVAINGYGRIGRVVHRQFVERFKGNVEVLAVNASSDAAMRRYLLKYDSLHGRFGKEVEVQGEHLIVEGKQVRVVKERDPSRCPWKELKVDEVVEATGKFRTREKAQGHLTAGASAVIITAPPKDDTTMIVRGINDHALEGALPIVSAASCTTNCIAPVVKVLDDRLGIARAAALNIIPSTTGAAKAIGRVFPHLVGKMDGMALRIPVPDVSAAYLALDVRKETTAPQVNAFLRDAAEGELRGILGVEEGQLVSADYVSNPHSSTVDLESTNVVGGTMVQILSWYDNEWGYAMRVTEMVMDVGRLL
ncbi:MAG: glyceraldehyde 3-phosphate dehydrogenase NAD-binding domain-containing protein [Patescibacteria group bacterium]